MTLVADWQRVLRYAWSIRFIILAGLFDAGHALVLLVDPSLMPLPRAIGVTLLASGLSLAATLARLVAQPNTLPAPAAEPFARPGDLGEQP